MVNFSIFYSTLFTGHLRVPAFGYKYPTNINIRFSVIFVNYFLIHNVFLFVFMKITSQELFFSRRFLSLFFQRQVVFGVDLGHLPPAVDIGLVNRFPL